MVQRKLPKNEEDRTLSAMRRHISRYGDGFDITKIAEELGIPRSTAGSRVQKLTPRLEPILGNRFEVPQLTSKARSLEELKKDRRAESARVIQADDERDLIPVKVNIPGPFGLLIFGDPHVDDPGCDFALLEQHVEIAQTHPYVFAGNIGDSSNSWIGRLARLYADQTVTARESWTLVEWLVTSVKWLFIIAGNHDLWAGSGDPIQWFSKQAGSLYEPHGVRLELQHPCGAKTRIHARHDFPGHSIYNSLHGPKREMLLGYRDHIVIAGHRHIGGHESTMTPDGICCTLVRVAGYKKADSYAFQLGLKKMPMHSAAFLLVDPSQPESSPARVHCAPTVEIGVKLLDIARSEYEATHGTGEKRRPARSTRSDQDAKRGNSTRRVQPQRGY